MNDLIIKNAEIARLDLSKIHNAALLKETKGLDALQVQLHDKASAFYGDKEAIRREQATILARIDATEVYKKDGFKNIKEYADCIGLGKSSIYNLLKVGKLYNDKEVPEEIKRISPSNLPEICGAIKEDAKRVYADAKAGLLDGMSQDDLREYAKKVKEESNKPSKAKIVKTYSAAYVDNDGNKVFLYWDMDGQQHDNVTVEEWKRLFSAYDCECVAIPTDKDGNKRFVGIDDNGRAMVYTLTEYKPQSNGKVKTTTDKAQFLARAAAEGMTDEQIATVCKVMGW